MSDKKEKELARLMKESQDALARAVSIDDYVEAKSHFLKAKEPFETILGMDPSDENRQKLLEILKAEERSILQKYTGHLAIRPSDFFPKQNRLKLIFMSSGGSGVGITSFFHWIETKSLGNTSMTAGLEFHVVQVMMESKPIMLLCYDFDGAYRYQYCIPEFVAGTHGAILMFDTTRMQSVDGAEESIGIARSQYKDLPILFCGSKSDLVEERSIHKDYAIMFLEPLGLFDYIEVSAKTGDNVERALMTLVRKVMGKSLPPSEEVEDFRKRQAIEAKRREEEEKEKARLKAKAEGQWYQRGEVFLPEEFKAMWVGWAQKGRLEGEWCDTCDHRIVTRSPGEDIGRVLCQYWDNEMPKNWWCSAYPHTEEDSRRQREENAKLTMALWKNHICFMCGKKCEDTNDLENHLMREHKPPR